MAGGRPHRGSARPPSIYVDPTTDKVATTPFSCGPWAAAEMFRKITDRYGVQPHGAPEPEAAAGPAALMATGACAFAARTYGVRHFLCRFGSERSGQSGATACRSGAHASFWACPGACKRGKRWERYALAQAAVLPLRWD